MQQADDTFHLVGRRKFFVTAEVGQERLGDVRVCEFLGWRLVSNGPRRDACVGAHAGLGAEEAAGTASGVPQSGFICASLTNSKLSKVNIVSSITSPSCRARACGPSSSPSSSASTSASGTSGSSASRAILGHRVRGGSGKRETKQTNAEQSK